MFTYIPIIITFVGATLGLTGSAWDANKTGLIKLTVRGWLSLTILLGGLIFSVYTTHRTNRINDYAACQRSLVKKLAYDEISFSLAHFVAPLAGMYRDATKGDIDDRDPKSIDLLISDAGLQSLQAADLYETFTSDDSGYNDQDYASSFVRITRFTPPELKELARTYSFYLDGEDIVGVNEINDMWLRMSFDNLSDNKKTVGVLYHFDDENRIAAMKDFLLTLKRVWSKVHVPRTDPPVSSEHKCKR